MGFNLGAFLGGAARGGSQVLDERRAEAERARVTKEERQWQIATEARAAARARKAARASKKKDTEEMAGLLKSLNFNDANIATALSQGKSAVALYAEAAKNNFGKEGFDDPNVLFEIAGANATPQEVLSTLPKDGVSPKPAEAPSLTATSELSTPTVPNNRNAYLSAAFGDPPPKLNSLNALHTNILQNMMATKDPVKLNKLREKEKSVLEAINKAAMAGDTSDEGSEGRKFTVTNIQAMLKQNSREALTEAKIQTNPDGTIKAVLDGQEGIVGIAQSMGVGMLKTTNNTLDEPDPLITSEANRSLQMIKEKITEFGARVARESEDDDSDYSGYYQGDYGTDTQKLEADVSSMKFGKSAVIKYGIDTLIYVGYNSPLATVRNDGSIFPFYTIGTGYR